MLNFTQKIYNRHKNNLNEIQNILIAYDGLAGIDHNKTPRSGYTRSFVMPQYKFVGTITRKG